MKRTALFFLMALATVPARPASALTLTFAKPATARAENREALGSYPLPVGPYANGAVPTRAIEGAVVQTVWQLDAPGLTTLELLAPLRDQLAQAGYRILYECEAAGCGGYDFRYGIDVLPEPDMHVDLGDFRFLAGQSADQTEHVSLIVSRSAMLGFVQVTEIAPAPPPTAQIATKSAEPSLQQPAAPDSGQSMAAQLEQGGAVVLEDVVFGPGSSDLANAEIGSLAALADYLKAHPDRPITLVGHTDAAGSLAANVALSRQRAQAVRQRLIETYGIPAAQVGAEGVGYLAPRASNLTEAGRKQNRRVEAMLAATE